MKTLKYCRLISYVLFVGCCILFVFMNKEYDLRTHHGQQFPEI